MSKLWNDRLLTSGATLRIMTFSQNSVILSNGFTLSDKNSVARFTSRLKQGWNIDLAYHEDEIVRLAYIKTHKSELARKGGISCQAMNPHIREIATKNLATARDNGSNLAYLKKRGQWNKGLTKETDSRILAISARATGSGNPMFGTKHSEEYKATQSKTMKENIKSGKFTPSIKNSKTHWQVEFDGKKFRSSWEAAWSALHPSHLYEQIRISYWVANVEKIYIVDFYDPAVNTLIEIKPVEHTYSEQFKAKKLWAEKWALENNGYYKVITQEYFKDNMPALLLTNLPDDVKMKIRNIK
jgi:hypothetical protein